MTANNEIRSYAKSKGVFLWEIADCLSLSDTYFSKKMRKELDDRERTKIFEIINEISRKKVN